MYWIFKNFSWYNYFKQLFWCTIHAVRNIKGKIKIPATTIVVRVDSPSWQLTFRFFVLSLCPPPPVNGSFDLNTFAPPASNTHCNRILIHADVLGEFDDPTEIANGICSGPSTSQRVVSVWINALTDFTVAVTVVLRTSCVFRSNGRALFKSVPRRRAESSRVLPHPEGVVLRPLRRVFTSRRRRPATDRKRTDLRTNTGRVGVRPVRVCRDTHR